MENGNGQSKKNLMIEPKDCAFPQQMNYAPPQSFLDLNNQFVSDLNLQNNISGGMPQSLIREENQNSEPSNERNEENEEKKNPKLLKRRSKSEIEGRNFECKLCNKSYLSYPALYTHYKLKHNTNNSSGRGRGRPKKEPNENEVEKSKYNPTNITFFSKEERTGKTDPKTEINNCIDMAFSALYESEENKKRNESREIKNYASVDQHPFLSKFKKDPHDINKNLVNEHEITDIVLMDYLNKMSMYCNNDYYIKLIKFVTLFREHVNKVNIGKVDKIKNPEKEYTEINDAEDVPDSSNEFITDFLHPDGETDFGFTKDESIDLTQNLCYWMYENNFTCSKLSLINNEK
jgi:hypothetical protein